MIIEMHLNFPVAEKAEIEALNVKQQQLDMGEIKKKDFPKEERDKLKELNGLRGQEIVDRTTQTFPIDGVDHRRVVIKFKPNLTGEEKKWAKENKIGNQADKHFYKIAASFPGVKKHALFKIDGLQVGILEDEREPTTITKDPVDKSQKNNRSRWKFVEVERRVRIVSGDAHWPSPEVDPAQIVEQRETGELDGNGDPITEPHLKEINVPWQKHAMKRLAHG